MAGKKDKVKDWERFSIIVPRLDRCMVCGASPVQLHEVFHGPYRSVSKSEGMVVPLCYEHHHGSTSGVHYNPDLDLKIKQQAQKVWMKENDADEKDFIKLFGKNYL